MELFQHNGLLVLHVMAKPGDTFASYDLLQAISATGMQFGEMNIFHYYKSITNKKIPLFSLASATEPGSFDFDRIGEFASAGLVLFMNIYNTSEPKRIFELMLQTAEQLTEDLDGELRASPKQVWNESMLSLYLEKIQRVKVFS